MESASIHDYAKGASAPYGRACTSCSRAKCKCIYEAGGGSCERCCRLKKDCQPSSTVRKRTFKKTRSSKSEQLQEKLDDLVSLLRSQTVVNIPQQAVITANYNDPSSDLKKILFTCDSTSTSPTNVIIDTTTGFPGFAPLSPAPTAPNSSTGVSPSPIADDVSSYGVPDATAEEQLNTFRHTFLPLFPFVHIPTGMSASDFRRKNPFLFLVIMSLTTKSVAQQLAMGDTIRQIVAQQVVAEHEKSLDILLGIICYLAWAQYHRKDKAYMTVWTQLVVALVFELGIYRVAPREIGKLYSKSVRFLPYPLVPQERTMDERRTMVGAFLVTSMLWTTFRKIEPLRWTSYLDDCVRILSEAKETEMDVLLATQAKYHIILDHMTHISTKWIAEGQDFMSPPSYFIKPMQLQLQNIRQSLPVGMKSNRSALFYMYSTEIIVKEGLIYRQRAQDYAGHTDLQRLEELESILTAIERWFEVFQGMKLTDWIGITFGVFVQFSHCIMLLFKLTTLDEPGWDKEEVKRRVNLLDILESVAQGLENIPEHLGLVDAVGVGEGWYLFRASRLIRGMKVNFLAEMAPTSLKTDVQLENNPKTGEFASSSVPDDVVMSIDEPWFTDIFGSSWDF